MNTEHLFRISQIAKSCSVSRSTILRLEEDGLIVPAYKDEKSGYRYYGVENLLQIRQTLSLRSFGFSTEEIVRFQQDPTNYGPLINALQERVDEINSIIETLRIKTLDTNNMQIYRRQTPIQNYYSKSKVMIGKFENLKDLIVETVREAIGKGVHLRLEGSLLILTERQDLLHGTLDKSLPCKYTIGIPVNDKPGGSVAAHPAGEMLCFLWEGDDDVLLRCLIAAAEEMAKLNYKPYGVIGFEMLMPDFLLDIDSDELYNVHWLFRVGIPVMPA